MRDDEYRKVLADAVKKLHDQVEAVTEKWNKDLPRDEQTWPGEAEGLFHAAIEYQDEEDDALSAERGQLWYKVSITPDMFGNGDSFDEAIEVVVREYKKRYLLRLPESSWD